MEEILFENVYTDTEYSMAEQYKKLLTAMRRIMIPFCSVCSSIIFLGCIIWGGFRYWIVLLLSVAYLFYTIFRHRIYARRYMKHIRIFYDGAVPETIHRFSEDTIYSVLGTQTFHVPIAKVDKLAETESLLILLVGKTHRMTLKKDGFTKGTYEEFLAFLRLKCPNLKLPE